MYLLDSSGDMPERTSARCAAEWSRCESANSLSTSFPTTTRISFVSSRTTTNATCTNLPSLLRRCTGLPFWTFVRWRSDVRNRWSKLQWPKCRVVCIYMQPLPSGRRRSKEFVEAQKAQFKDRARWTRNYLEMLVCDDRRTISYLWSHGVQATREAIVASGSV